MPEQESDIGLQMMLAEVKSMSMLLDQRVGDNNPWRSIDFGQLDMKNLQITRKMIHELLYAPPARA